MIISRNFLSFFLCPFSEHSFAIKGNKNNIDKKKGGGGGEQHVNWPLIVVKKRHTFSGNTMAAIKNPEGEGDQLAVLLEVVQESLIINLHHHPVNIRYHHITQGILHPLRHHHLHRIRRIYILREELL